MDHFQEPTSQSIQAGSEPTLNKYLWNEWLNAWMKSNVRQCKTMQAFWPLTPTKLPQSSILAHSGICHLSKIAYQSASASRISAAQMCEESKMPVWQPLLFLILCWYYYCPSPCCPLCLLLAAPNSVSPGKIPLMEFLWSSFFSFLFLLSQNFKVSANRCFFAYLSSLFEQWDL